MIVIKSSKIPFAFCRNATGLNNNIVLRRSYAKEKFSRAKPHLNIGTIGHVDHGKVCFIFISNLYDFANLSATFMS